MEHARCQTFKKEADGWRAFEARLRKLVSRTKDTPRSKGWSKNSSQKPARSKVKLVRTVPQDKEAALKALKERQNNPPKEIDNASLYAGSPMYYYCESCGHLADVLPESDFSSRPKELCKDCQTMKYSGWLE